jgi:hypothetical protein
MGTYDCTNSITRPLDLVESNKFPPCWDDNQKVDSGIATPATERQHVHAV